MIGSDAGRGKLYGQSIYAAYPIACSVFLWIRNLKIDEVNDYRPGWGRDVLLPVSYCDCPLHFRSLDRIWLRRVERAPFFRKTVESCRFFLRASTTC